MISKQQFISGTIWKLIETFLSVGTTFIISIILARLLSPKDFGLIALTSILINFSEIVLQSAFTTPLIQRKVVDYRDYSSVLCISLIIATVLYLFVYIGAPYIASYYEEEQLISVIRVICLLFFIQGFGSVRTAIIQREMRFKLLSITNFIATIISGCVGIGMAFMSFGIWSLVIQKLLQQALLTIMLFIKLHWCFSFSLELSRIKLFFSFGLKVLGSSLLSFLGDSTISAVTGKVYSMRDLGYSSKGSQYPNELSIYSFQALLSTLLPTLSTYQDNPRIMKMAVKKVVSVSSYLLFPMMAGLFVVAEPVTIFLLTDKWLLSVPYMKMACIYYSATPLMLINIQVFHSLGKGEIRLITEIIRTILIVLLIIIGIGLFALDLYSIIIIKTIIEIIITIVTVIFLKKTISYGMFEYLSNICIPLFLSIVMAISVFYLKTFFLFSHTFLLLLIQILLGTSIYLVLSFVFKPKGFSEIQDLLKYLIYKKTHRSNIQNTHD